jgi:DNA-binding IclR family transcriptional regulator
MSEPLLSRVPGRRGPAPRRHNETLSALSHPQWRHSHEVAQTLGYSPSRAREYLRDLHEMGLVERCGNWPDRGWRWRRAEA